MGCVIVVLSRALPGAFVKHAQSRPSQQWSSESPGHLLKTQSHPLEKGHDFSVPSACPLPARDLRLSHYLSEQSPSRHTGWPQVSFPKGLKIVVV